MGIYTGARLNELAQLKLSDIQQKDGIWCFDINDNVDDDAEARKRLKNKASKRLVPIHSHLLDWGILDYIEVLKEQGREQVFPELKYEVKHGYGRNLSRWFNGRFLVKLGIKTRRLVFHSLRHTVATELSRMDVEEGLIKDLIGHTQDGELQVTYHKGYLTKQRKAAIEKIFQDLSPSKVK